jgi:hypothetical protein
MISDERMIGISRQAFRLLLYAYPARFRKAYGAEMAQVFRDEVRGALQMNGLVGLPGL